MSLIYFCCTVIGSMPASRNTDPDFPAPKILIHEVTDLRHDRSLDFREQCFHLCQAQLVIDYELQRIFEYNSFTILICYLMFVANSRNRARCSTS